MRFFAHAWPTRGLKNLLVNICRRLTGSGGEAAAIFRPDTSYGGGKTHWLIAPGHAARGMANVPNTAEFIDPALLPQGPVRIATPRNFQRVRGMLRLLARTIAHLWQQRPVETVPELISCIHSRKGSEGSTLRALRNNLVFVAADDARREEMRSV